MPGFANPQNLNRYSYVGNSPLNYTDPTGHERLRDGPIDDDFSQSVFDEYEPQLGNDDEEDDNLGSDKSVTSPTPSITLPLTDPSGPQWCNWVDCALAFVSILTSGIITAVPEIPEVSGSAFVVDLVVTFVAYRRTNQDYEAGKISRFRQGFLNITGIVGVLPVPYIGLGLSIINGMATATGYPP